MNTALLYTLLFISISTNIVLLVRIQQLQKSLKKIKGGVELSREELEQLRARLKRLKNLH
jgi:hypothetical protein